MTTRRWFEIERDVASASRHFGQAVALATGADMSTATSDGYRNAMAVMHAMQSGHTSLESALVRLLRLLGEDLPEGADWHAALLRRVSHDVADRPALLDPAMAKAADRTRSFRHVAMRGYDSFDEELAAPALAAAGTLAERLPSWLVELRRRLDP